MTLVLLEMRNIAHLKSCISKETNVCRQQEQLNKRQFSVRSRCEPILRNTRNNRIFIGSNRRQRPSSSGESDDDECAQSGRTETELSWTRQLYNQRRVQLASSRKEIIVSRSKLAWLHDDLLEDDDDDQRDRPPLHVGPTPVVLLSL